MMALGGSGAWTIGGLFAVSAAISAFTPTFWCVPAAMFTGTAAAAAIALINSVGNLGGYLGPMLLGKAKDANGGYTAGLLALGVLALTAAALLLLLRPRKRSLPD
jgi:ACS family tartrate transporter-like MFS transporter